MKAILDTFELRARLAKLPALGDGASNEAYIVECERVGMNPAVQVYFTMTPGFGMTKCDEPGHFEMNARGLVGKLKQGGIKLVLLSDIVVEGNGTQMPFDEGNVRAGTLIAMRSCLVPFLRNDELRLWLVDNYMQVVIVTVYDGKMHQHSGSDSLELVSKAAMEAVS